MTRLLILNDPPYGTERTYNGLRLAIALQKANSTKAVTVFLMADAVAGARKGQRTPDGFYNVERMLRRVLLANGSVLLCGTCMDARGLGEEDILEGAERSTMDALAAAVGAAEQVLVF